MKYVSKKVISDKLCIHCKLHVYGEKYLDGHGCMLVKNYVDGSAMNSCQDNRPRCGGDQWIINEDIVIGDTEEQCEKLTFEEKVVECLPYATEVVKSGRGISISCGYLDEAIRRVKSMNNIQG